MTDDRFDRELARDIIRYYLRNPRALDTLEGIARWRLLDERIHRTIREVREATSWLIERGLLEEDAAGRRRLIGLNRERLEEARRFAGGEEETEGERESGSGPPCGSETR